MPDQRAIATPRILDCALIVMILGATSVVAMQAVSGDWFPPEVSISQYGVGRYGWVLTMTLVFLSTASALLLWGARRLGAVRTWRAALPWAIWTVALLVMAFVPTNEWPGPLSLRGEVHQAAAVLGLSFAPVGAVLMVVPGNSSGARAPGAAARLVVIASALLSWVFLLLLVLTNVDIDPTGLGDQRAWSLHQTVAVVLDIVMIFALIIQLRARAAASDRGASPASETERDASQSASR